MKRWDQLLQDIPLLQALNTEPYDLSPKSPSSFLLAPIALHRNHKLSIFGGSISLLTTTLGWFHVAQQLNGAALPALVIRDQQVHFLKPISNDALLCARILAESQHNGRRSFAVEVEVYNAEVGLLGAKAHLEYVLLEE